MDTRVQLLMRGVRESGTYGPSHSSRVTEATAAATSTLSVLSAELILPILKIVGSVLLLLDVVGP